jgi:hypothetical protein
MPTVPDHWQPGDSVILRNCGFFIGEAWGTPHVVIEDTDERVVLFRPEGTRWAIWSFDDQTMRTPSPTRMDMLRLMFPGQFYAVELYFATETGEPYADFAHLTGRFRGWKLNIEGPFKRTEHGFDTTDDVLDIFVEPDGTWHWTDETELAFWVEHGAYKQADHDLFFATGEAVEKLIEAGSAPFDDEWVDWQPPAGLVTPTLPEGWQHIEGWDIALSSGRRYDAWRDGHDVPKVAEAWRALLRANRETPGLRRFRSGSRRKG